MSFLTDVFEGKWEIRRASVGVQIYWRNFFFKSVIELKTSQQYFLTIVTGGTTLWCKSWNC